MHGVMKLSRRGLITRAAALCSASVAPALRAFAAQVQPDDPRIHSETVRIPTPEKGLEGYFSRPGGGERRGSVIVLHDYWGMRPHYQDVARRLALEGFAALVPDYASRFGGTPAEKDPAREMVSMEEWPFMIADTLAALAWLGGQGDVAARCAAVGFGWGGSAAGRLASKMKEGLAAAVVFYGHAPPLGDVPAIAVPLLLNYAGADSLSIRIRRLSSMRSRKTAFTTRCSDTTERNAVLTMTLRRAAMPPMQRSLPGSAPSSSCTGPLASLARALVTASSVGRRRALAMPPRR